MYTSNISSLATIVLTSLHILICCDDSVRSLYPDNSQSLPPQKSGDETDTNLSSEVKCISSLSYFTGDESELMPISVRPRFDVIGINLDNFDL